MKVLPISIALGVVFAALTCIWACNPGQVWWRKRELVTDLCYWFFIPLVARYLRIGLLVLGAAVLFGITTAEGLVEFYDNGHGPLAQYPLWLQGVVFLVVGDFLLYWIHRGFHRPRLWKFHAGSSLLRGSGLDLRRALPSNQSHAWQRNGRRAAADRWHLTERAGVHWAFTIAHSAFVHANLNWTLGPFKYVLSGPVFHRWHHTAADRGGSSNFAPTFPILDVMFGTFYMPANERPDRYGVADPVPASFGGQMLYPFK